MTWEASACVCVEHGSTHKVRAWVRKHEKQIFATWEVDTLPPSP